MVSNREPCHSLVERTGRPDPLCLERAAVHVAHDIYLLRHAWVDQELRIGWTMWFIRARVLMDFFFRYGRAKNKHGRYYDDILACDFLPAGEWKKLAKRLEQEKPADYEACRTVANKLSAHLTYSRVDLTPSGSTPLSDAVYEYLLGVAGMWLDALEPERRAWFDPWFPRGEGWSTPMK